MISPSNCPNCGARVEIDLTMSRDRVESSVWVPGRGALLIARERWTRWRCVGLWWGEGLDARELSPPCGWFRWRHHVSAPGGISQRRVTEPVGP